MRIRSRAFSQILSVRFCYLGIPGSAVLGGAFTGCVIKINQTKAKTVPFNTQPTMLWSENDLLNCLLNTYAVMQYRYHTGKITHEKYFEWKLQWSFDSMVTHSSSLPTDIEALIKFKGKE